jgi:uncharacterized protein (TIGR02266 family)
LSTSSKTLPPRRFRRRTLRVRIDYQVDGVMRCEWATTLGAGGMFIETEDPPPVGARVKLRFRLSEDGALHEVEGRVAWTMTPGDRPAAPIPSPGMGVEFRDAVAVAALARELERLGPG